MNNKVQLITYIDRLGCKTLQDFKALLEKDFKGLFGGVHILPFYYPIDGEDAGFDPIDHQQIDPRLGNWADLAELGEEVEIMADLIVNHMSAQSAPFLDYLQRGQGSAYRDLFLTYDTVFPEGATAEDLLQIYRPRPGFPFTKFQLADGSKQLIWTTFTSNQIDIDVKSTLGIQYLEDILETFRRGKIKMIRLDAVGYAIKEQGSSCFMTEETFDFIEDLTQKAASKGIEVLVEIHSYYRTQIEIAKRVNYVYDFALPVLVLDALFNKNATSLKNWLAISPRNAFTVLDTHDGIGIIDVASEGEQPGLIGDEALDDIVKKIHSNSGGASLKATGAAASNLDLYQVNCTYYDALGKNDQAYLIARAIQFFVPGIPQVYYVGFLAAENDMALLQKTNVGRDINRHYFDEEEVKAQLQHPMVQQLKQLMILRNEHPAFNGTFSLVETSVDSIHIKWEKEEDWAALSVDLQGMKMNISCSSNEKILTATNPATDCGIVEVLD